MRKNQSWLVFVEGETEQSLIKELKEIDSLIIKDIKKFNFWDKDAKSLLPLLKSNCSVVIICDTDNLTNIDRFTRNIRQLAKQTKGLYIILQHHNFEDELCYACGCQGSRLFKHFQKKANTSLSATEFKVNFLSCSNKLQRLQVINFDKNRIWSQVTLADTDLLTVKKFVSCFNELLQKIDKICR